MSVLLYALSSFLFILAAVTLFFGVRNFLLPIFFRPSDVNIAQGLNIIDNFSKKLTPSATGSGTTTDGIGVCLAEDNGKYRVYCVVAQKRLHEQGWS